ncbi:hypothetical protein KOW79_002968 [Hemibagrus wyckioides]|uniref:CCHC-type domain-containing protein n=1 Tax=Hemibagrus wyckioides TaxID=337641 RepID=A0A9D3P5P8_9TELE|nr:hypothetical protein KOW79_002968 [Hemibagrus wyckioides]
MRCFECGDIGHKRFACPHSKHEEREVNRGPDPGDIVRTEGNQEEVTRSAEVSGSEADIPAEHEYDRAREPGADPEQTMVLNLESGPVMENRVGQDGAIASASAAVQQLGNAEVYMESHLRDPNPGTDSVSKPRIPKCWISEGIF